MTLDAIIQFIQSEMESNKKHTGDKGSMNRAKIDEELLYYLIDYKRLLEQTSWISVNEQLPEDEEYVLVCYADGHIRTAYYYIDTNIYPSEFEDCCETGWYNYNEDFMYEQDVVAWMYLLEQYKESGE